MSRTLEQACRDFYHIGFLSFDYIDPQNGVVRYQDGEGNQWRSVVTIENGKMKPLTAEIERDNKE